MKPVIKICCPVYDMKIWEQSLARACVMSLQSTDFSYTYAVARTAIIAEGRNTLITENIEAQAIKQKLNKEYTHWLFVDHDCGFTVDNIRQLLNHDKDIISGAYRPKDKPERFVAGFCEDSGKIMDYCPAQDMGLVQVDWAGAGFLLCKRGALERMSYPYFWYGLRIYGNRALTVGEDVFFCLNARKELMTIYLDTNCVLNHEVNR